jgi:malonate decarboxylase epsilon subunit
VSIAFIFPGQGSQYAGMLARLPEVPVIRSTLAAASDALGLPVTQLDTDEALRSTECAQLAIFIVGMASACLLGEYGVSANFLAGHSLGAFTAAAFAGVFSFADGLRLVKARGQAMHNAHPEGYGMATIVGLDRRICDTLVFEVHATGGEVYVGSQNASDEITISGSKIGLARVIDLARARGARRAVLLDVSVPSHTPLMALAAKQVLKEIQGVPVRRASTPYVGNCAPRVLVTGSEIVEDLARAIDHPVRWGDATSLLYELGVRTFIEMPPGDVLARLTSKSIPGTRCVAADGLRVNELEAFSRAIAKGTEC